MSPVKARERFGDSRSSFLETNLKGKYGPLQSSGIPELSSSSHAMVFQSYQVNIRVTLHNNLPMWRDLCRAGDRIERRCAPWWGKSSSSCECGSIAKSMTTMLLEMGKISLKRKRLPIAIFVSYLFDNTQACFYFVSLLWRDVGTVEWISWANHNAVVDFVFVDVGERSTLFSESCVWRLGLIDLRRTLQRFDCWKRFGSHGKQKVQAI